MSGCGMAKYRYDKDLLLSLVDSPEVENRQWKIENKKRVEDGNRTRDPQNHNLML